MNKNDYTLVKDNEGNIKQFYRYHEKGHTASNEDADKVSTLLADLCERVGYDNAMMLFANNMVSLMQIVMNGDKMVIDNEIFKLVIEVKD